MGVFFIDTDSELWYDKVEEFGLKLIRMPYFLKGQEYLDDGGKSSDYKSFFAAMREGEMPKTAALNEQNYLDYFEPYFAAGEDMFYLTFSHQLSATFQFMESALEKLRAKYPQARFRWFDSKGISMSCGIQCYYAGKMYKEGKSFDEIIAFLEDFTKHVSCTFVVDDLHHLKRGGRISATVAILGGLLGIKPVIKVTDEGKLVNVDKIKGSRRVISYMAEKFNENVLDCKNYDVWIMQGDCLERGEELKAAILEKHPEANVHVQMVGPVIGAHCGPGTLGLIYYGKTR